MKQEAIDTLFLRLSLEKYIVDLSEFMDIFNKQN